MKVEAAIAVARELREYRDYDCKHVALPRSPNRWVKQFAVKRSTGAQFKIGERVMALNAKRTTRTRWVRIADIVSSQRCLGLGRLIYQLRRHPIKRRAGVIRLPGGKWLLWDGNHRVAAALLRGATKVKVTHFSPK